MTPNVTPMEHPTGTAKRPAAQRVVMEPGCSFARNFVPTENADPVVVAHVRNCADCQDETFLMIASSALSA